MNTPTPYIEKCIYDANTVMLRTLYLSWRTATRLMENHRLLELAEGIIRFTE